MAQITATELAGELQTTPREVRKFLRSVTEKESRPGKGSRWTVERRSVQKLRRQFSDWSAAKARAASGPDSSE